MSGWDSRILIRTDDADAYKGAPESTLNTGELAAGVEGVSVEIRAGIAGSSTYVTSPVIAKGEASSEVLAATVNASPASGDLVHWDGSSWQTDGNKIEFSTDSASGVLTYTATTDTWATDTSSFVPSSLDGGTFTGSFVAPSFAASYQPSIGDA